MEEFEGIQFQKSMTPNVKNSMNDNILSYMFSFSSEHKAEMLNMIQYSLLVIIPVLLMNKGIGELFSDGTDEKTTIELSMEVIAQLFIIVSSIFLIHKFVVYFPTYSEVPYAKINMISVIFIIIIVLFTFQTNINNKTQHIFDNIYSNITNKQSNERPFLSQNTEIIPQLIQPVQETRDIPNIQNRPQLQPQSQTTQLQQPNQSQMQTQPMMSSSLTHTQPERQELPNYDSFFETFSGSGSAY